MKVVLLLVLVVCSLAAVYTVDCTAPVVTLNLDDNCLTTYRKVNGTGPQSVDALDDFLEFCVGGGAPITGLAIGDELVIIGNCVLSGGIVTFGASPGTGNFTIRGSNANTRPTISFQNSLTMVIFTSNPNTAPHNAGVVFRDLILTTNGGAAGNVVLATLARGNAYVDNVQFLDFSNNQPGSAYIYHLTAGTNVGSFPRYVVNVNNLEVRQTVGSPVTVNAPIIRVQNYVDVVATSINIHDTRIGPFIAVEDGITSDDTININVADFRASAVDFRSGNCFVLCSLDELQFSDYSVNLDNITVIDSVFASSNGLVGWRPTYDQYIDGEFTLSNSNFRNNDFSRITSVSAGGPAAAIVVFGRGQTTLSDNSFSDLTLTNPLDGNTIYYVDNTDGAQISGNTFSANLNFVHGVVKVGLNTANTLISGNTFSGNIASSKRPFISKGGALHLLGGGFVDDNDFISNFAENGGAVFIDNVDVFFSGDTFDDNNATNSRLATFSVGYGGAVLKNMDGLVAFENCQFTNNYANRAGGALAVIADNDLAGITFYYGDGGDLLITDCTFDSNTAPVGGALLFSSRNLITSDSNFTRNSATTGGAVSCTDVNPFVSSPVLFRNSRFSDNFADGGDIRNILLRDGGAVSTERAAQFTKCAFESNQARDGNGGGITAYKGLSTDSCKFLQNSATGVGGAIWSNPTQPEPLDLTRSDFVQNSGTDGGALWTNNPQTNLIGATFTENQARQNGGAAYLNTKATVDGTGFELNSADSDGGALYSTGDLTITRSRFESNYAGNDGGAIFCRSQPLGQVDFTLRSGQKTFMRNNTAVNNGGAIETTCNVEDTGTIFTESHQKDSSFGVECIGDLRQLRDCEMLFRTSQFITDSLGIFAPQVPLDSISTGLRIDSASFNDFDGFFQAQTTSILNSKFVNARIQYDSPTTIEGSEFSDGNDQFTTGPTRVDSSQWSGGIVNVSHSQDSSFGDSSFENVAFTSYNGAVTFTDIKVTDNSNVTFFSSATLTRVSVDETSTTTSTQPTSIADSTVGAFHGTTGSLVLTGNFQFGGEGLDSSLAIPVSGSGDLIMLGGTFTWTNGDITGSGDFVIMAGEAHLQSGSSLDRITTAEEAAVVFVDNSPAFTLSTNFDAKGGAVFGQDTADGVVSIAAAGSGAAFNTWMDTFWAPSTTIAPNHNNYGNYHFDIVDRTSYDRVKFEGTFGTENTSFVFAQDERTVFYYENTEFDNGTEYLQDLGTRFDIINLPSVFDIDACGCVSPFAGAVYTYNINVRYPDRNHKDFPAARISTRNETHDEGTEFLYLYASASSMQPALFFLLSLLAFLF